LTIIGDLFTDSPSYIRVYRHTHTAFKFMTTCRSVHFVSFKGERFNFLSGKYCNNPSDTT
jgi:hypothetical protein